MSWALLGCISLRCQACAPCRIRCRTEVSGLDCWGKRIKRWMRVGDAKRGRTREGGEDGVGGGVVYFGI